LNSPRHTILLYNSSECRGTDIAQHIFFALFILKFIVSLNSWSVLAIGKILQVYMGLLKLLCRKIRTLFSANVAIFEPFYSFRAEISVEWTVKRRFREFAELHETLLVQNVIKLV
jgi:PX domain